MPIISLLVEIIDSDAPNHGVFSGARRREKGAQEGGELVISRAKKAKWTYVQWEN